MQVGVGDAFEFVLQDRVADAPALIVEAEIVNVVDGATAVGVVGVAGVVGVVGVVGVLGVEGVVGVGCVAADVGVAGVAAGAVPATLTVAEARTSAPKASLHVSV